MPGDEVIGVSVRPASCCCSSKPLGPGSITSSTRQQGTVARGRERKSRADANVSGCQLACGGEPVPCRLHWELTLAGVRASPSEYLALDLRAHDLLQHVPLYDVSVVELPGGGAGRSIADVRALDSAAPPSLIAIALYGLRRLLGRLFGWDDLGIETKYSLAGTLSERDRRESEVPAGTADGAFRVLYRFRNEQLNEIRNATVQGYVCTALIPTATGYRFFLAVYVLPVSWFTRPYLIAIEPFRRFLLYPAMLRRIQRAWRAKYGSAR